MFCECDGSILSNRVDPPAYFLGTPRRAQVTVSLLIGASHFSSLLSERGPARGVLVMSQDWNPADRDPVVRPQVGADPFEGAFQCA